MVFSIKLCTSDTNGAILKASFIKYQVHLQMLFKLSINFSKNILLAKNIPFEIKIPKTLFLLYLFLRFRESV
jgi:hypothetical protein